MIFLVPAQRAPHLNLAAERPSSVTLDMHSITDRANGPRGRRPPDEDARRGRPMSDAPTPTVWPRGHANDIPEQ